MVPIPGSGHVQGTATEKGVVGIGASGAGVLPVNEVRQNSGTRRWPMFANAERVTSYYFFKEKSVGVRRFERARNCVGVVDTGDDFFEWAPASRRH